MSQSRLVEAPARSFKTTCLLIWWDELAASQKARRKVHRSCPKTPPTRHCTCADPIPHIAALPCGDLSGCLSPAHATVFVLWRPSRPDRNARGGVLQEVGALHVQLMRQVLRRATRAMMMVRDARLTGCGRRSHGACGLRRSLVFDVPACWLRPRRRARCPCWRMARAWARALPPRAATARGTHRSLLGQGSQRLPSSRWRLMAAGSGPPSRRLRESPPDARRTAGALNSSAPQSSPPPPAGTRVRGAPCVSRPLRRARRGLEPRAGSPQPTIPPRLLNARSYPPLTPVP